MVLGTLNGWRFGGAKMKTNYSSRKERFFARSVGLKPLKCSTNLAGEFNLLHTLCRLALELGQTDRQITVSPMRIRRALRQSTTYCFACMWQIWLYILYMYVGPLHDDDIHVPRKKKRKHKLVDSLIGTCVQKVDHRPKRSRRLSSSSSGVIIRFM